MGEENEKGDKDNGTAKVFCASNKLIIHIFKILLDFFPFRGNRFSSFVVSVRFTYWGVFLPEFDKRFFEREER